MALPVSGMLQGDFQAFLYTATGFATIGRRNGKPFVDVKHGAIDVDRIVNN